MGAEASSLHAAAASTSRRTRKAIVQKWQRRQQPVQLFSIVRHAERADGIYAFFNKQRWTTTEDFTQWPVDPPLSDAGFVAAEEIGQTLARYAAGQNTQFNVVISSPYYRCVQTAVRICRSLGPGARLLLDRSLGEVFGPAVMGHTEPLMPVRGVRHTLDYCRANGVVLQEKAIGTWPTWPEELKSARQRYALRFLAYLRRSAVTRRNFVLVGHADCVGSVLSTMPSQMNEVVEKVEYGGYLIAKRKRSEWSNPKGHVLGGRGPPNFTSVAPVLNDTREEAEVPAQESLDFEDLEEAGTFQELHPAVQRVSWGQEGPTGSSDLQPVKESGTWKVELHGISMRPRQGSGRFRKHLRGLAAEGEFTTAVLEELLGELGTLPLVANEEMQPSVQNQGPGKVARSAAELPSFCSLSTYLFGASASELGEEAEDGAGSGSSRLNTDNSMSGRSNSDTEIKPLTAVAAAAVQALGSTRQGKSATCRSWQEPTPQHRAATLHSVLEHVDSGDEEEHNPAPRKYRTAIGSLPKMLASGCSSSPPETPTLQVSTPPFSTSPSLEVAAGPAPLAAALEPPPVVFKSLEGSKLLQRRRSSAGSGARPEARLPAQAA